MCNPIYEESANKSDTYLDNGTINILRVHFLFKVCLEIVHRAIYNVQVGTTIKAAACDFWKQCVVVHIHDTIQNSIENSEDLHMVSDVKRS